MVAFTATRPHPMKHLPEPASHQRVDDEDLNTSGNPRFADVLDARLSRRSILRGGVGSAASGLLGGVTLASLGAGSTSACAATAYGAYKNDKPITSLRFMPVAKAVSDLVSVPAGYTASVVVALGDPLDATTGKELWRFRMGGAGRGQPVAYEADGKTYVAIPSGGWSAITALSGGPTNIPEGGQLFVFTVDE